MDRFSLFLAAFSSLALAGMAAVIVPGNVSLKPGDTLGGNFPLSVHFVGNVEGKSYFAENITMMNFTQAGSYCEGMGMKLGSISSVNQTSTLADGFSSYFNGTFWTSGRDAHQLRQFSWNSTNTALNSAYVRIEEYLDSYLTCVAYHSVNATEAGVSSHLDSAACSLLLGTLCET